MVSSCITNLQDTRADSTDLMNPLVPLLHVIAHWGFYGQRYPGDRSRAVAVSPSRYRDREWQEQQHALPRYPWDV